MNLKLDIPAVFWLASAHGTSRTLKYTGASSLKTSFSPAYLPTSIEQAEGTEGEGAEQHSPKETWCPNFYFCQTTWSGIERRIEP